MTVAALPVRPKMRGQMFHRWRNKKMAKYRKLSRTSSQRKALLRNQVTSSVCITERLLRPRQRQRKYARLRRA